MMLLPQIADKPVISIVFGSLDAHPAEGWSCLRCVRGSHDWLNPTWTGHDGRPFAASMTRVRQ